MSSRPEVVMNIELPDGSKREVPEGASLAEVAASIGPRLAKDAIAGKIDGRLVDLAAKVPDGAKVEIVTAKSDEGLEVIRHSTAHLMANAVQELFPGTQVTIGPVIEDGFYYDFATDRPFTDEDLARIEEKMTEIAKRDTPVRREEWKRNDAVEHFESIGEKYKAEIIRGIPETEVLSVYRQGEWKDLCRGPHVPSTGKLGAFKLTSVAGAYWRGDSRNAMLQRIYGTAWPDRAQLDAYLRRIEEARARDHRKLGKELDLFHFHPFAPGAAFWTPNGTTLYNVLAGFMREVTLGSGYVEIRTPLLFNKGLWEISGHWGKYRENMFLVLDSETGEHDFSLKPMNCPSHHLYYGMTRHSYRDLPLRLLTYDVLHRNEASGTLGGLTRVRQFAQDDAHIYCLEEQVPDEVRRFVAILDHVYGTFGLEYTAKFSTRPPVRIGDDALWDRAEGLLRSALDSLGRPYELKEGEGAFYGPKVDFDVSDSLGRKWQLGTIQLDYNAPERFELTYVGSDNAPHRPAVLHRAIYGSFERFIAILVEHFAGAFPFWLAPVQAIVLPLSEKFVDYGRTVEQRLKAAGIRTAIDESNEKLGAKIRTAQLRKIPLMLVVGEKEAASGRVSVRKRTGGDQGAVAVEELIELARRLIVTRSLTLE
ncbi:MAG TPA: threonine--tRNA ligase [Thermoanaerobaculia bacterium]|nr:threonine--tRNA ligase [Thermoanaerobaculia bacterium]